MAYVRQGNSNNTEKEYEQKQRDILSNRIVKRNIYITEHRKDNSFSYAHITADMILEKRAAILALRYKKENGLLKKDQPKEPKKIYERKCSVCGNKFIGKTKTTTKCSDECAYKDALNKQRIKYEAEWIAPPPFECLECGKMHQPIYGDMHDKYCSDRCAKRNGKRNQHHARRCRLTKGFRETVYKAKIWARDRYTCQICGKKVALKQKAPHPYSPSLDHIIPLSKGGTHEPKNVRLVHFIYNSLKSDGVSKNGDQLLLFG